jgi:galacturonokinase
MVSRDLRRTSAKAGHGAPPVRAKVSEAQLISQLVARLDELSPGAAQEAVIARAPLRICPLGAHIDHQLGIVTGMTLDQAVLLAFVPATNGRVYVESLNFGMPAEFDVAVVPPYQKNQWANYVRGAVQALQQEHSITKGMIGVVGGAMPIGGLSSSAAVTVAYLLALEAINQLAVDAHENIALCRHTENQYIGLNNGILDQSVILFSQPHQLTKIDCLDQEITRVAEPPGGGSEPFEILVVYSGLSQALVGTGYNNRVAECRAAAWQLLEMAGLPNSGDSRLRHVTPELFATKGHYLDKALARRAQHYFGEMERVAGGVAAWQKWDMPTFGELMNESGESSIKYYECGSPQLITIYETLRDTPGVYGTRFSGAGFRGNCIALINPTQREEIAEAVHRVYPTRHPAEAEQYSIHFCLPDGAAKLLAPGEWHS